MTEQELTHLQVSREAQLCCLGLPRRLPAVGPLTAAPGRQPMITTCPLASHAVTERSRHFSFIGGSADRFNKTSDASLVKLFCR